MLHEIAMEECCGPWQDTKCISQVQRVLQVLNAHCQPCWCLLCVMLRHDLSQSARDFQIIRQNEAVHEHVLGFICWRTMNNICHRLMPDTGSTKYQLRERINDIAIKGSVAWAWDGKVRIVLWCAVTYQHCLPLLSSLGAGLKSQQAGCRCKWHPRICPFRPVAESSCNEAGPRRRPVRLFQWKTLNPGRLAVG